MSHAPNRCAPGLEALRPLVGKWHTEGAQLESPLGPASPFVAVETFEWLDGGHFLVHRLDGRFGKQPAACIEIIGKDARGLFAQTFYNDGNVNRWRLDEKEQSLVMTGTWPANAPDAFQIRFTMTVTDMGNTLEGKWEYANAKESSIFQTFLEARATKALPLPNTSVG